MRRKLGTCLVKLGRFDEAEVELRGGYDGLRQHLDSGASLNLPRQFHASLIAQMVSSLIELYERWGKPAEAEPLCLELLALARASAPADEAGVASALAGLGRMLLRQSKYSEAEPLLRECLAIRERVYAVDHPQFWYRYNAMSMLGGARSGQGRLAEAEALLLDGYNGMKDDPMLLPGIAAGGFMLAGQTHYTNPRVRPGSATVGAERKREALERIVKLYEAWSASEPGKVDDAKAAEWRAKLAEFDAATQPGAVPGIASQPAR